MNHAQVSPDPRCPMCRGVGAVAFSCEGRRVEYDSDQAHSEAPCQCVKDAALRQRLSAVARQLPRNLRHVGLDRHPINAMPAEHTDAAKAYVADLKGRLEQGRGLWFVGPKGTGKTTVAAAIYLRAAHARICDPEALDERERWAELGLQVAAPPKPHERIATLAYWRYEGLLNEIRRTYRSDGGLDDVDLLDRLKQVDLLVLDDIGAERATDWAVEKAYSILADREENGRAVIATTNLEEQQLDEQIGERAVSRLHAVTGEIVRFSGVDHRRIEELAA